MNSFTFFALSVFFLFFCFTLSFLSITNCKAQCNLIIDFNTWSQQGNPAAGNWVVQGGGASVLQTINGEPTFFVSPDTIFNSTIEGEFQVVNNGSDDDFVGFVFGYVSPVSSLGHGTDQFDFYLFDWKRGNQSYSGYTAQAGMSVNRVQGTFTSYANDQIPTFWGHQTNTQFQVLANNFGSAGWAHNTLYEFRLTYETNRIRIWIDNVLQFDIAGTFQPGRFGFYNHSQPNVNYMGFKQPLQIDIIDTNHVSCAGYSDGNIWVQAENGTPPYTYAWSNGATGPFVGSLSASSYTVTATDATGCDTFTTVAIIMPPPLLTTHSVTNESCNPGEDGAIDLSISGGTSPYSFNWNVGNTTEDLSGIAAGTYTVTITDDNNCVIAHNATVGFGGNSGGIPGLWMWLGTESNDWFNPCNWDKTVLPSISDNVLIPGATPYNAKISAGTGFCRQITINASNGGHLEVEVSAGGKLINQP